MCTICTLSPSLLPVPTAVEDGAKSILALEEDVQKEWLATKSLGVVTAVERGVGLIERGQWEDARFLHVAYTRPKARESARANAIQLTRKCPLFYLFKFRIPAIQ